MVPTIILLLGNVFFFFNGKEKGMRFGVIRFYKEKRSNFKRPEVP